jgi:hypothetical protein
MLETLRWMIEAPARLETLQERFESLVNEYRAMVELHEKEGMRFSTAERLALLDRIEEASIAEDRERGRAARSDRAAWYLAYITRGDS